MRVSITQHTHNTQLITGRETGVWVGFLTKVSSGWAVDELPQKGAVWSRTVATMSTLRDAKRQAVAHFAKHSEGRWI